MRLAANLPPVQAQKEEDLECRGVTQVNPHRNRVEVVVMVEEEGEFERGCG